MDNIACRRCHGKIDAGMIRAPENIMINNNKVTGNGISFVKNILVDTLDIVNSDGKSS